LPGGSAGMIVARFGSVVRRLDRSVAWDNAVL
jgi:hypothetical protein